MGELEAHGLVQRHGFKNRYGATEALWKLRDQNLIWGNFPLGSQTIDLVCDGRHLGSIPRVNLPRLNNGTTFRFAGKCYKATGVVARQFRVKPASGQKADVHLVFSNSGPAGLDVFVANALWHWLFETSAETSFMTPENWVPVGRFVSKIREASGVDTIPYTDTTTGRRYFTFAGLSVNRVILSWLGLERDSADDLSIETRGPVDWNRVPVVASDLMDTARKTFAPSDKQTIFQQRLPMEFQEREWLASWLKDDEITTALTRLKVGRPVAVSSHLFAPLRRN